MLREHTSELGMIIVIVGTILLLSLRFWTSPLTQNVTNGGPPGLFEFLLIPTFFIVVGAGIALALWEPDNTTPE